MKRRRIDFKKWALLWMVTAASACSSSKPEAPPQPPQEKPVVTDERTDLILTWTDEEGAHVASRVAEVPEANRGRVRVQDPKIPPEKRDPAWVFIADLSQKVDGRYRVHAVLRSEFEEQRHPGLGAAAPATQVPGGDKDETGRAEEVSAPIVMYATKTCPVCQKARRWLLDIGIRYIEKDVGSDPAAMAELERKARAQGVPTGGVPVFDVRGKLVPGFDKKVILELLSESRLGDPGASAMTI